MSDHRADQAFHKSIRTLDFASGSTRTETDNLRAKQISAGAYWGLNVSRALATHANIADLVVASGLLTREQVTEMLSPDI